MILIKVVVCFSYLCVFVYVYCNFYAKLSNMFSISLSFPRKLFCNSLLLHTDKHFLLTHPIGNGLRSCVKGVSLSLYIHINNEIYNQYAIITKKIPNKITANKIEHIIIAIVGGSSEYDGRFICFPFTSI